jgi:hypothetical protein
MGGCYSALSRADSAEVPTFHVHEAEKTIRRPRHAPSVTATITVEGSDDHSTIINHNTHLNVGILGTANNGTNFSSRYWYDEDPLICITFQDIVWRFFISERNGGNKLDLELKLFPPLYIW